MPRSVSLSFDLLETFVKLVDNGGNAATTARELRINQPSMSKRLRYLQFTSPVLSHPWLVRDGKTWKLTDEGRKALPAVRDLVNRYDQLTTSVEEIKRPSVVFACGRQAAVDFVRKALEIFRRKHPDDVVRVSTLRGQARIEGVANGSLDLATVTYDEAKIKEIARRDLHVELLRIDRLALVCSRQSPWAREVEKLPKKKLPLAVLTQFPLILLEPDAGIRRSLDERLRKQGLFDKLDIQLEIGGWGSIMSYVSEGLGVGLVSESAIPKRRGFIVRTFHTSVIEPLRTRLICRPLFEAADKLDLPPPADDFYTALKQAAAHHNN